jgi:ABC-type uncharacterized transport system permease subunit
MSEDQLAIVLLGAFWAGTSFVYSGIKNTNEVRDKIVLGKIGNDLLPVSYLWRLLLVDWLPLKLSLALVSLALGIIILLLPSLRDPQTERPGFRTVCYVAAVMPVLGFVFQLSSCVLEGVFLRRTIEQIEKERTQAK